jgi:hypothetical protein
MGGAYSHLEWQGSRSCFLSGLIRVKTSHLRGVKLALIAERSRHGRRR